MAKFSTGLVMNSIEAFFWVANRVSTSATTLCCGAETTGTPGLMMPAFSEAISVRDEPSHSW